MDDINARPWERPGDALETMQPDHIIVWSDTPYLIWVSTGRGQYAGRCRLCGQVFERTGATGVDKPVDSASQTTR